MDADGFINEAAAAFNGIDILVANASGLAHGNAAESWRAAVATDLMSTVHAVGAAEPYLQAAAAERGMPAC